MGYYQTVRAAQGKTSLFVHLTPLFQSFEEGLECFVDGGGFQVALPECDYFPAFFPEGFCGLGVVVYVAIYFIEPPVGAGLGDHKVGAAFVSVPEAAVYEDDGVVAGRTISGLPGRFFTWSR